MPRTGRNDGSLGKLHRWAQIDCHRKTMPPPSLSTKRNTSTIIWYSSNGKATGSLLCQPPFMRKETAATKMAHPRQSIDGGTTTGEGNRNQRQQTAIAAKRDFNKIGVGVVRPKKASLSRRKKKMYGHWVEAQILSPLPPPPPASSARRAREKK